MDFRCWPYEDLVVERLEEPRAFLFKTPWHTSQVSIREEGLAAFERAFLGESSGTVSPAELLDTYSKILTPLIHEPFSYILSQNQEALGGASFTDATLPPEVFSSPRALASYCGLSPDLFRTEWCWDDQAILATSKLPATSFHSPLSLYSIFRRFFYLDAMDADRTRALYADLPKVAGSAEKLKNALAYVIVQNLHVTECCGPALSAGLGLAAGSNGTRLRDFIHAERGHDKIMAHALAAFPFKSIQPWAKIPHPCTRALMVLFQQVAKHSFLSFAFAIHLFERPQHEAEHPLTRLLRENGFDKVADRYEKHHAINEAGGHEHIGFDMVRNTAILTEAAAIQAARWAEMISWIMASHSAHLLEEIEKND